MVQAAFIQEAGRKEEDLAASPSFAAAVVSSTEVFCDAKALHSACSTASVGSIWGDDGWEESHGCNCSYRARAFSHFSAEKEAPIKGLGFAHIAAACGR